MEFFLSCGSAAVGKPSFGAAIVLASLSVMGCSEMDPGADTFELLQSRGGQATPPPTVTDWSCIGDPPTAPPSNLPESITYQFPFVDWVSDQPIAGRVIQVCNKVNPPCDQPIGAPITVAADQRVATVTMRPGLDFFFQMRGSATYVPETLWPDGRAYSNHTGGRIQLLSGPTVQTLAQSALLPLDGSGTLGIIAVRVHDCAGTIAGGAIYSINDTSPTAGGVFSYTFVNGQIQGSATPSTETVIPNDLTPWAGFINVRPGQLTITATLEETGEVIGTTNIDVRANTLAIAEVRVRDQL